MAPAAEFLDSYVWGWPEDVPLVAAVLVLTGLYVTTRLVFIQIRGFKHAVAITRGVYDNPEDEGDLSHFQALTTALSATVGIGNIAGVAIAIRMGGPGALFWMWLTAFFGMALKYTECTLAVKYRTVHGDGSVSGGPMYYIERGLGKNWKWMAILFAICGTVSSCGSGCMNQSNTLAVRMESSFGVPTIVSGLIFATLVAAVIIGGIKRIGRVTSILAPSMALMYVAGALLILLFNFAAIPGAFSTILTQAFAPESLEGGAAGSLLLTIMWGIRRGLFSNEAGQGSAPIAHATAKTDYPVREGLVASLEPFIDTLVICTMTGLVIVTTGVYKTMPDLTGADLTAAAFSQGLPGTWGQHLVTIAVILFAVSTGVSWSYYGDRMVEYLVGPKAIKFYRWAFVLFFFFGAILPLEAVWLWGDVALGMMTFPNLIAILLLTGQVVRMTHEYFAIDHKRYK
ncbi:transporter [Acidobacteria bacterium Mor1]|nr:transporter [Acidobacteria bacterium Mor1]